LRRRPKPKLGCGAKERRRRRRNFFAVVNLIFVITLKPVLNF
jgi:hypothetical protein